MKQIYLVRHAESEGNAGPFQQGPTTPLSEKGGRQKETVAERFRSIPIDCILSSPQTRAKDTAEAIAAVLGQEIEYSQLLVERRRPSAIIGLEKEGPAWREIQDAVNANYHDHDWHHSDEENFPDLRKRALALLAELESRPEERILLVTHGFFMRMILACVLFGPELSSHAFTDMIHGLTHDNAGITLIEEYRYEDSPRPFRLVTWNDRAHLG